MNFSGRLAIQQRVLPGYRVPFLENLGKRCRAGLAVCASKPLSQEAIQPAQSLANASLTELPARHFMHPRHPLYLCWQSGLVSWLAGVNPDVLIVEANPRYLSTMQAIRWMRARSRPVLGWGLGAPPLHGPLAGFRTRARRKLLSSLDGVIAYSSRGAAEYRDLGILPQDAVYVALNAVRPPPEVEPPLRPPLQGRARVLFVGRLQARKRLDLLFEACAGLPEGLQPDIVVVGDGPAMSDFKVASQSLYPRVTFRGGLYGEPLEEEFRGADLFVLPGTGGLALQEAMSHGLPVIAAEGDGTQEDLVRPEVGWLVPPGNMGALRDTLRLALEDPSLREKGQEAYRLSVTEFNIERMAESFIQAVTQAGVL